MAEPQVDFTLSRVTHLVVEHKNIVATCALLGVLLGGAFVLFRGIPYRAESQVVVGQPVTFQSLLSASPPSVDQSRLVDLQRRVLDSETMADLVDSQVVDGHADYSVEVSGVNTSNVITIAVTSSDRRLATDVASTYATTYVKQVEAGNLEKIDRAAAGLENRLAVLQSEIEELTRAFTEARDKPSERQVLESQRAGLLQQVLSTQARLDQVNLARSVDPTGGAAVIENATEAEASVVDILLPAVVATLLGLVIGLGVAAARDLRSRKWYRAA